MTVPVMRPWLGEEERAAVDAVLTSGWVAQGPRVAEFEAAVAACAGAPHGVAVSSCTAGLHLALHLLGLGPGDEVVVPSLSFIATANSVRQTGATPIFADVDADTQNLTAKTVEPVVGPRTRAIMVVHQAGVPADLDGLHELADPLGITIVEDAACALGSTERGAPVGARGNLAAFSFHPRKIITTGEGGLVTTHDAEQADRLRRLREHGMNASAFARHASSAPVLESYLEPGFNYRMTDLQAAVGIAQMARLTTVVEERRARAHRYQELLLAIPGLQVVTDPPHGTTNYQSFWVVLPDDFPVGRDALLGLLAAEDISARRGIMAAHREPAYADTPTGPLPVTDRLTDRSLILPLFHGITDADQDRVVDVLRRAGGQP